MDHHNCHLHRGDLQHTLLNHIVHLGGQRMLHLGKCTSQIVEHRNLALDVVHLVAISRAMVILAQRVLVPVVAESAYNQ